MFCYLIKNREHYFNSWPFSIADFSIFNSHINFVEVSKKIWKSNQNYLELWETDAQIVYNENIYPFVSDMWKAFILKLPVLVLYENEKEGKYIRCTYVYKRSLRRKSLQIDNMKIKFPIYFTLVHSLIRLQIWRCFKQSSS